MKTDVKQHDATDCGPACICSVARHYGVEIPLSIAREASGTNELGTSIKGIIDAFGSAGFEARGYSSSTRDVQALRNVPLPAVLHTVNETGGLHFIVLFRCDAAKVTIMDPAAGRHTRIGYDRLRNMWSGHLIIVEKGNNYLPDPGSLNKSHSSNSLIFRYHRIACFAERDLVKSLPGSFFSVLAGIGTALCLQHIIDTVLPSGDTGLLCLKAAELLLIYALSTAVSYFSSIFTLRAGIRIDAALVVGYLRHLFSLPPGFFAGRSTGELNSRIGDAVKIRRLITEALPGTLTGIFLLAGALLMMFSTHRKLALIVAAFVPAYLILTAISLRISRKMNRRAVESAAQFERRCVESIASVRNVKYFGSGSPSANAEKEYARLSWNLYRNGKTVALFAGSADMLGKLLAFSIITAGGTFILKGTMTVGELVSFYSVAAWFSTPLAEMARLGIELNEANLSLERLDDILVMEPEGTGGLEPENMTCAQEVTFREVTFSYPGCPTLLHNFNLTIPAGKILCITGGSGCGKSSVAALLMRDIKPSGGHILLGMNDISLFNIDWWREYVTIVPQEPRLTGDSILDNISGGEKNPDLEKAARIMDELGMKEFITSLPLGMLTPAGEGGCLLSGGQRQRVAMARALWRDPKILILDEATASLDSESQKYILKAARRLRDAGRTVIMITHRKDNAETADLIFHMEGESARPDCAEQ